MNTENYENPKIPNETITLDELRKQGGTEGSPHAMLTGNNIGNNTLVFSLPARKFFEMSEVDNREHLREVGDDPEQFTQRPLDTKHARNLAVYMLKGIFHGMVEDFFDTEGVFKKKAEELLNISGRQPYHALQPIVCNLRSMDKLVCKPEEGKTNVWLREQDIAYVVDGQHRRWAMHILFEWLEDIKRKKKYPFRIFDKEKGKPVPYEEIPFWQEVSRISRSKWTVCVEMHQGLSKEQERQLFFDLNVLGKVVSSKMVHSFTATHPFHSLVLKGGIEFRCPLVESRTLAAGPLASIEKATALKASCMAAIGKPTHNSILTKSIPALSEHVIAFWEIVMGHPDFGKDEKDLLFFSAGFLMGVAKFFHKCCIVNGVSISEWKRKIHEIDISWKNPIFTIHYQPEDTQESLKEYLEAMPSSTVKRSSSGTFTSNGVKGAPAFCKILSLKTGISLE